MKVHYYITPFLNNLQVCFDILLQNTPSFLVKIPNNSQITTKPRLFLQEKSIFYWSFFQILDLFLRQNAHFSPFQVT